MQHNGRSNWLPLPSTLQWGQYYRVTYACLICPQYMFSTVAINNVSYVSVLTLLIDPSASKHSFGTGIKWLNTFLISLWNSLQKNLLQLMQHCRKFTKKIYPALSTYATRLFFLKSKRKHSIWIHSFRFFPLFPIIWQYCWASFFPHRDKAKSQRNQRLTIKSHFLLRPLMWS